MVKRQHDDDSPGGSKKSKSKKNNQNHQQHQHVNDKDDDNNANNNGSTNSNAIPIFLKKTYRMIEACDPNTCSWSEDGDMFVVKQPEQFASEIIPQYFDHNKFSSFARQLNFYGFRKIQTKPIRNEDFDKSTAKHVTFFNEKFKRGRYDLLKEIQRSTRGGGAQASLADQAREMETLRNTVIALEQRVADSEMRMQDLSMKMEREIQTKVELAMMDLLSSRSSVSGVGGMSGGMGQSMGGNVGHANPHLADPRAAAMAGVSASTLAAQAGYMAMPNLPTSFGDAAILQRAERSFGSIGRNPHGTWENPLLGPQAARAFSTASASSGLGGGAGMNASQAQGGGGGGGDGSSSANASGGGGGATLPPHPKQKSLPPPTMGLPQSATGPIHNMTSAGGLSLSSATNSSNLLRNAWEDKFFSTLMMTDGASRAASLAGLAGGMAPGGMAHAHGAGNVSGLAALAAAQQMTQQQNKGGVSAAAAGNYAAYMQERAQRGISAGVNMNGVNNNNGNGHSNVRGVSSGGNSGRASSSSLKRQTTAEILLEAAGELGNGGKDKGGRGKPDSQDAEV